MKTKQATVRHQFIISTAITHVTVKEGETVTVLERVGAEAYRIEVRGLRCVVGKFRLRM